MYILPPDIETVEGVNQLRSSLLTNLKQSLALKVVAVTPPRDTSAERSSQIAVWGSFSDVLQTADMLVECSQASWVCHVANGRLDLLSCYIRLLINSADLFSYITLFYKCKFPQYCNIEAF